MRKAISILLLALLLYNLLGYQMLFYWRIQALEDKVNRSIDQGQVNEHELLVFKVVVPLYHQVDKDFERVEGSFQYEGQYYQMVKRKLEKDTIYTYCLPNQQRQALMAQLHDHVQTHVADFESSKPSKPEKRLPNLLKEYLPQGQEGLALPLMCVTQLNLGTPYLIEVSAPALAQPTPPPETT